MKLNEYIQKGIENKGSAVALAKELDLNQNCVYDAKRGQRGLPSFACIRLAEIIKADPLEVIAASELITEKKEERKAIWERVLHVRHAATVVAFTLVTGFLTPADVQASTLTETVSKAIYIMSN